LLPEVEKELRELGFDVVPVIVVDGAHAIAGFDVPALERALGIDADAPRDLPASELLEKYRAFFLSAKRAVLQIPNEELDWVTPQDERRGQTLRQLAFHLFDRPDVCMDAARTGRYTYEMCHQYEHLANGYRTTQEIVEYADAIESRLIDFLTNRAELTDKVVETYFGPKTVGKLLNMALVGTGLRIKQTYHFLRAIGVEPENPMREEEFAGVPVPKKIFG
jgi:hypothetical protein